MVHERSRSKKPEYQVRIAKERMSILLNEALKDKKMAKRYVELARKIGMRYNVRMSPEQKRKFCKYCNSILLPESEVRLKKGVVTIKCFSCHKTNHYPYKPRRNKDGFSKRR